MLKKNLYDYLNVAKEASVRAAAYLKLNKSQAVSVQSNAGKDLKIQGDFSSEQIIFSFLKQNSNFSILSEEHGWLGEDMRSGQDCFWIVDPIDGSFNFVHDIPWYGVSIGLWKGDEPLLGVIYDFERNAFFSGIVGEGAWLNDSSIYVSTTPDTASAVLATGFPVGGSFSESSIRNLIDGVVGFKKIRMLGSAALSLAYVASGRVDAYYESDIMLWDVGAGIPIVKAAGGMVTVEKSLKPNAVHVKASNPKIHSLL